MEDPTAAVGIEHTFGTTLARSASSHTIAASFPPSSSVSLFTVLAQASATFLPVAVLPVKLILLMPL